MQWQQHERAAGFFERRAYGAVIDYAQSKVYIKSDKMQKYGNIVDDILLIILKVLDKSLAI